MLCNVVYAMLAARCLDEDSRKQLDDELYAPAGGWESRDKALWAALAARVQTGGD